MKTYNAERGVVLMTMDDWKRTHADSKGVHKTADGKRWRSVLYLVPGQGTCLVPVEIVKETR